jgi:hypothetical protein
LHPIGIEGILIMLNGVIPVVIEICSRRISGILFVNGQGKLYESELLLPVNAIRYTISLFVCFKKNTQQLEPESAKRVKARISLLLDCTILVRIKNITNAPTSKI